MVLAASHPSRRRLLHGAAAAALGLAARPVTAAPAPGFPIRAEPFPMEAVRLAPSPFLSALQANQAYLLRLEPDRLLHNFRSSAGLEPKGRRLRRLGERHHRRPLAGPLPQRRQSDACPDRRPGLQGAARPISSPTRHLPGGPTPTAMSPASPASAGDVFEDGKVLFSEWKAGDIRVAPFYLNGCWVPLYNFHKTLAGLLDAHRYCADGRALAVATAWPAISAACSQV